MSLFHSLQIEYTDAEANYFNIISDEFKSLNYKNI